MPRKVHLLVVASSRRIGVLDAPSTAYDFFDDSIPARSTRSIFAASPPLLPAPDTSTSMYESEASCRSDEGLCTTCCECDTIEAPQENAATFSDLSFSSVGGSSAGEHCARGNSSTPSRCRCPHISAPPIHAHARNATHSMAQIFVVGRSAQNRNDAFSRKIENRRFSKLSTSLKGYQTCSHCCSSLSLALLPNTNQYRLAKQSFPKNFARVIDLFEIVNVCLYS